jgi:hypothetical protein
MLTLMLCGMRRLSSRERTVLERRGTGDWLAIPDSIEAANLINRGFMETRLDPMSGLLMWRATAKGRRALRDQPRIPLQL